MLWLGANPAILNPLLVSDAYSKDALGNIYDFLVSYDAQTGEPKGQLAKSWTISKDGFIYEFQIRKNALFHDGRPVTAEDVKFTFDRIKDPKVDAAHLQNYFQALESVKV